LQPLWNSIGVMFPELSVCVSNCKSNLGVYRAELARIEEAEKAAAAQAQAERDRACTGSPPSPPR
jgi:hypothetical protein